MGERPPEDACCAGDTKLLTWEATAASSKVKVPVMLVSMNAWRPCEPM